MTQGITLNIALQTLAGTTSTAFTLRTTLVNYGAETPAIAGGGIFSPLSQSTPFTQANLTVNLYGNDQISPAGTRYLIELVDSKSNTVASNEYELLGSQTLNLSMVSPYTDSGGGSNGAIYLLQVVGAGGIIGVATDPVTQIQYTLGVVNGVVTAIPIGGVTQVVTTDAATGGLVALSVASGAWRITDNVPAGTPASPNPVLIDTATGEHFMLGSNSASEFVQLVGNAVAGVSALVWIDTVDHSARSITVRNGSLVIT